MKLYRWIIGLGVALVGPCAWAASITGTVVDADAEARTLTVEIGSQEGVALESPTTLRVSQGELQVDWIGAQIRGRVSPLGGGWYLDQIWPQSDDLDRQIEAINTQLRRDTASRSVRDFRTEGDSVPPFALIDEEGKLVTHQSLRGRRWVLNFIFTRCAVPHMCPANTVRMARLQDAAREAGVEDFELVTITFDPTFDTPGILNAYATARGIELDNYTFLTGPESAIDDLLRQFGIVAFESDGTIDHTMATFLVDQNGRIQYRKDGSRWTVEEFLSRL